MKKIRFLLLFAVILLSATTMRAQSTASGTVVDGSTNEPIIGASVVVKGSAKGGVTDLDGHFDISVPEGSTLTVSYLGYLSQDVQARQNMRVVLQEDNQTLDDVVVIGYGVQKKSVVTAAIAKVTSDDLVKSAPVRMDDALKGLAAGVTVTSASGQPGDAPKILVRGAGTINNGAPLYIVDGVAMNGGLSMVNPGDIASIEVLKDAASAAIYGTRGANGVVLVTTKKGNIGKTRVEYDFSYGWQNAAKKRTVTGVTDYAIMQNEMYVNAGQAPKYADPYNLTDSNGDPITGQGWNWQDMVFNKNAPVTNHNLNVSGATEKVNYYMSLGYFSQEGIVGGDHGQSNYRRMTLHNNTTVNLVDATKERNYLNKWDLTVDVSYAYEQNTGISTNSEFGSILGSALYMSPLLAPTVTDPDAAAALRASFPNYTLINDTNGNPYTIPSQNGTYQESNNPLALMQLPPTKNWQHNFLGNFSTTLNIWDNLKFRFSFGAKMGFWGNESSVQSLYYLSGNNNQNHTSASMDKENNLAWQVENTLSYDKQIGKHYFDVVLGQAALKEGGTSFVNYNHWGLVSPNKPYPNYTNAVVTVDENGNATVPFGGGGGIGADHMISSLFGRISYNYDEKYMIQATLRRDGSSNFGANFKYGYFPSVSAGWNITNEEWLRPSLPSWISSAKLRVSWGRNGVDNLDYFAYTSMMGMGEYALFGNPTLGVNGSKAQRLANPNLHWEQSEQTDIGLDLGFLDNALTFTVDWYSKKTIDMLIPMPIANYVGEAAPWANLGTMDNSGVEFEASYRWNIGSAQFSVKGNTSYLHNELTNLGNSTGFIEKDGVQGYGIITRAMNGLPFPYFFGYKTAGVFQTMDDVHAYINEKGGMIQPDAKPGWTKFVDVDEDGTISADDRTNIGNGTPKWTYGLMLNAAWKGFDFNLFLQGVAGNDVFDATHRSDIYSGNFPSWMLDRWTGPGTSNKYPLLSLGDANNWLPSDLYICDASFLRVKNVQIGYTLPQNLTRKFFVEGLRVYVMAGNLFTFTKYWGFDPELASGGASMGVDRGVYPQARTYTVGFNISF